MEKKEIVKTLESLAQLDMDAWHAYGQAIDKAEDIGVRHKLEKFRADHERHVSDLSDVIRNLGQEPPKFSRDFKGFLIEGWTAVRSITGVQGVLAAMDTNEKLTNRKYDEATKLGLPTDIHALVVANYKDEKEHLAYIKKQIDYWVKEKDTDNRGQYY
jgi:uncharacterized protein (TIGR02284 family)